MGNKYFYLSFLCLNLWLANAFALTSDRSKPVYFSAGHASLDEKTGEGHYSDGVSIDQGSTHLRAFEAFTMINTKHEFTRAIAHGDKQKQAHFWTSTSPDKPPLHAYADTLSYDPLENKLELVGHARIIQGENILSAPTISYDTKAERLITTASSDKKQGTVMLLNPKSIPKT
ncbi:MAG: lipopolysaccharide transport periplasmic protein LptA [Legionellaceae bacterium]|nr:lipopolysaccharide transport periplasmic protein LptA [Legionellaceae bacterium]